MKFKVFVSLIAARHTLIDVEKFTDGCQIDKEVFLLNAYLFLLQIINLLSLCKMS